MCAPVIILSHRQHQCCLFSHSDCLCLPVIQMKIFTLIMCVFREGEDGDSQGDGSSQPDTISIASRTSQNTVDSDKVGNTHMELLENTSEARGLAVRAKCKLSSGLLLLLYETHKAAMGLWSYTYTQIRRSWSFFCTFSQIFTRDSLCGLWSADDTQLSQPYRVSQAATMGTIRGWLCVFVPFRRSMYVFHKHRIDWKPALWDTCSTVILCLSACHAYHEVYV